MYVKLNLGKIYENSLVYYFNVHTLNGYFNYSYVISVWSLEQLFTNGAFTQIYRIFIEN